MDLSFGVLMLPFIDYILTLTFDCLKLFCFIYTVLRYSCYYLPLQNFKSAHVNSIAIGQSALQENCFLNPSGNLY